MVTTPRLNKIPISILIFENNGRYSYRAYSPTEYNPENQNTDWVNDFITKIYNKIGYNLNSTRYGKIKEIHTRKIKRNVTDRGDTCFFSTYQNEYCRYNPIHCESPLFFTQDKAVDYESQQPNLIHLCCPHELV